MPLHLDSIMNCPSSETFAFLLQTELSRINDVWADADKIRLLGSSGLYDARTGRQVGQYVFTFLSNPTEKRNELLDMDIVLNGAAPVELEFLEKYPQSSDANEYYEVSTIDTKQHLDIETVNRAMVPGELTGTKQNVYCSAFPFQLTIFEDMADFHRFCGFGSEGVRVSNTEFTVHGLSETFISPGGLFPKNRREGASPWAFVVGRIRSYEEATLSFGKASCDVIIAQLETALGTLPVMMGREVFDVKKIATGKIVAMDACIKANFSDGPYPKPDVPPKAARPADEPKKRKGWFRRG